MEEKLKILIADDNEKICEMIADIIKDEKDMQVVNIATDGKREIEMIEEYKPHVVITDLRRKNGVTGLQIIDMYNEREHKPIFFVISAELMCNISPIFKKYNINYFANKPFTDQDITSKLYEIKSEVFPKEIVSVDKSLIVPEKKSFFVRFLDIINKKFKN